ncbi:MAG: hypothetical protein AB9891_06250 [Anaerolineaceae bacterium]
MKNPPNSVLAIALGIILVAAVMACNFSIGSSGSTAEPEAAVQSEDARPTFQPPAAPDTSSAPIIPGELIRPEDLTYMGAFRLPDDNGRPRTFEYGGSAMTFRPGTDPENDGFPGTLFITGHDRLAYGELTDGSQVAEISIPAPLTGQAVEGLNTASFVQGFSDLAAGHFAGLDEIPRIGMAYLDHPATGPLLHLAWGQHMPPDPTPATHAWVGVDFSKPDFQGEWFIGSQDFNSVNGYIFEIPAAWADAYTGGKVLATGRYRDGGWSGMGPALFAYQPWTDASGTPAAHGAHLQETVLLQYESSISTESFEHALKGYQHPDEWEGGAWLTTANGKSAVVFVGTKSVGEKYWYGWVNPAGSNIPCIEDELIGQFTLCRLADGSPCPESDLAECLGHNDFRGWWSTAWEGQMILYDPADLARVAAGELEPWQPQPYATLSLEPALFHNPSGVEVEMIGQGAQRRFRIGDVAFDRANGLIYVLELFADGAKPVVHVWRFGG